MMTATLAQLVQVRSQLAEGVLNYLTQLADKLDLTDWWRGSERIKASEIAVEPFVFTMRKRERPTRSGPDREGREMDVERRSPMDEIEAERYELPVKVEEREEERWHQVIRRGRVRLGLKGAPGSGKTFTTWQTMVALAREAAAQLEQRQAGVEKVELPVWVTAKHLAQTGAREIEDALLEAMENGLALKLAPNLRAWLKQQLNSSRAFVIVDALDELLESDRAPFEAKAKPLDGLQARVIATCRTMQWEDRKGWLGWGRLTEVELAPFKRRQQREFTGRFFERQPDLRQNMERLLQVNFALRHACTTPLLLTFACLLHEEGKVNESTSYAALYADMLRWMFTGKGRKIDVPWTGDEDLEEDCLQFLEGIAWRIFVENPQLNKFTRQGWQQAAEATQREWGEAPLNPSEFRKQLRRVGLIVPAGFDEQRRDRCWSFTHRTFLEFLAARALSRMEQQVWLAEAKQHFWFQPEWLEVLTFLAGLVDDATLLIKAVEKEQKEDDLFGQMLSLKAKLVGASKKVDEHVIKQACSEVYAFWRGTLLNGGSEGLCEFAVPKLTLLAMNDQARDVLAENVLALLQHGHGQSWQVFRAATEALGRIGSEKAIERLLDLTEADLSFTECRDVVETLGNTGSLLAVKPLLSFVSNGYWYFRYKDGLGENYGLVLNSAMEALAKIGGLGTVEGLLALTRDKEWTVRLAVVEALGEVSDCRAVEGLLALTKDEHEKVRAKVAIALGKIGDERAVEGLMDLTKSEDVGVRQAVAYALGEIGGKESVEGLLALIADDVWNVRLVAARALGKTGNEKSVGGLIALTKDEDLRVRRNAILALGQIGDHRAVEQLLALTQDENSFEKDVAAEALSQIGGNRVIKRLLELTLDKDPYVRHSAVLALGQIGAQQAIERLLTLTQDEDVLVRGSTARALDYIGNRESVKRLFKLMRDKDEGVRLYSTLALGRIGDQQAVNRLLELTRQGNSGGQFEAVKALGESGSSQAVSRLLELTNDIDRDDGIRQKAVNALWKASWKNKQKVSNYLKTCAM